MKIGFSCGRKVLEIRFLKVNTKLLELLLENLTRMRM